MCTIAVILALIFPALMSEARADACQAALAAYNNAANAGNAAYGAKLAQIKGFGTPAMLSECPKVIALMQSRIADAHRTQSLLQRVQAACSNASATSGATAGALNSANMNPEQLIATAQQVISLCRNATGQAGVPCPAGGGVPAPATQSCNPGTSMSCVHLTCPAHCHQEGGSCFANP